MTVAHPLWTPSPERIAKHQLTKFASFASKQTGEEFDSYDELHDWSCETGGKFWDVFWDFAGIIGDKGSRIVEDGHKMPGASFFPDAKINFAENLLKFRGTEDAIVFRGEDKIETRLDRDELYVLTSRFQAAFVKAGLQPGDRVAAMMPNMPETIAAMLAATSLGAIWSSCSPDFGDKGVLDRFGQITPKIFITCDGYWYNGKQHPISSKLETIIPELGCATNVIVPLLGIAAETAARFENTDTLDHFLAAHPGGEMTFLRGDFSHPLFILFSSGTTGVPKCITHSHGGCLIQLMKEHMLHMGAGDGTKMFYFTTCGWMMWNWLVAGLAVGETLMLYDGSPFYPDANAMFDYAEAEKFNVFGTSAKFIDAVRNTGNRPIETHDLSSLELISSTGSPLAPENFEFVYSVIHNDIHLSSMSGGTDICGCFVGGVPWQPVYVGEIQGACLGMKVEVWNDDGNPMNADKGELVCTQSFPSMPVKFWNDDDGSKYSAAYFERFDNIWCHGDFAEWTTRKGMVIHGRSDATLNPGGVRIGTAEIYNQVEKLPAIEEALCIGQQWESDVRIVLFVKLADGIVLDDALEKSVRDKIRTGASPRHVPAKIVAVSDIPRTKSGKITELAVRDIVHGREVKNKEALANPEALELFRGLEALKS